MWVSLNDEGKRVWGDVFPDGKVPVSTFFGETELEGRGRESVALIYWKGLSFAQQEAILKKLSAKFGAPRETILEQIKSKGLPLPERYTTGIVTTELKYFV